MVKDNIENIIQVYKHRLLHVVSVKQRNKSGYPTESEFVIICSKLKMRRPKTCGQQMEG